VLILALLASATVAFARQNIRDRARRISVEGQVTAIGENSLTLSTPSGKSVTVTVSDQTKIHLSRSQIEGHLSDIQVGNSVRVRGRQNDDGSLEARLILVLSSWRTKAVRIRGQVTAVKGNAFTLHAKRGDFTILTDDSTQYQVRGSQEISIDNLKVGGRVLVKGIRLEGQTNTIQARQIRFSLSRGHSP
jgi:hypothetical protein